MAHCTYRLARTVTSEISLVLPGSVRQHAPVSRHGLRALPNAFASLLLPLSPASTSLFSFPVTLGWALPNFWTLVGSSLRQRSGEERANRTGLEKCSNIYPTVGTSGTAYTLTRERPSKQVDTVILSCRPHDTNLLHGTLLLSS